MKTNPNESLQIVYDLDGHTVNIGLTKREYFAAMAMNGIAANSAVIASNDNIAKIAVSISDAMIAALNETP